MQGHEELLNDVRTILDRVRRDGRSAELTLRSGIVLRFKAIPPVYLQTLNEQFILPPPPQVKIERGDDSYYEENPNDQAWARECAAIEGRQQRAVVNLMLGMGTEVVSVPEGRFKVDDDGWVAEVRRADKFTGVETPLHLDDPDMRYLSWLTFYALDNIDDMQLSGLIPQFLAGPTEGEIAQAVDAFRNPEGRSTDPDGAAADARPNGSQPNRRARRAGG